MPTEVQIDELRGAVENMECADQGADYTQSMFIQSAIAYALIDIARSLRDIAGADQPDAS